MRKKFFVTLLSTGILSIKKCEGFSYQGHMNGNKNLKAFAFKNMMSASGNNEPRFASRFSETDQHNKILDYTPEEAYSRCLTPKHKLEYNGYMLKEPKWKKLLLKPIRFVFPKKPKQPGTLILVRHGETEWSRNQTFIGWADPDLTESGIQQAEHAAR